MFSDGFKNSELKSTDRCGWFCKRKKEINCTIQTTFAAGICGLSVAAILTGQVGGGAVAGVICIGLINQSVNCWKNI